MNVNLVVSMAQSFVKDSAITYDEFDKIYADLSRKEQYEVVNILYDNGINLIDEHIQDEASVIDPEEQSYIDTFIEVAGNIEEDPFVSLFRDPEDNEDFFSGLVVNKEIKQSNAILCSLIQQGYRQAAQDLCIKNKALVDKYASAYLKRYGNGLDFDDLEQVGFMGLLKAAEKYDANSGAFTTYAVYWIKQAICREIFDNGFLIRIPVHMMERINKVTEAEFLCPGEASLSERMQFVEERLGLSEQAITECIILRNNILANTSLATLVGDDEESELGDFIPADEDNNPVETAVISHSLRTELEKLLSQLTDREQKVIMLRYGWDGEEPMTLEQIGMAFNVTRERIRQIEERAIRRLKHPSRSKLIKIYTED